MSPELPLDAFVLVVFRPKKKTPWTALQVFLMLYVTEIYWLIPQTYTSRYETHLHIVLTMLVFSPAFSKIYNLFSGTMYETTQCKCRYCFLPWRFFRILFACRICFLHSEIFSCAAAILFSLTKRCTELDWSQTTHVNKPFY